MRKLSRILNREEYSFLLLRIRKIEILNFPRVAKGIRLTFLSAQRSPYVKVENLNFPRVVKGIRLTFPPLCS